MRSASAQISISSIDFADSAYAPAIQPVPIMPTCNLVFVVACSSSGNSLNLSNIFFSFILFFFSLRVFVILLYRIKFPFSTKNTCKLFPFFDIIKEKVKIMNGFYEIEREENKSVVLLENDDYKGFSNHYHNNLEILLLKKGTGKAVINGIEYEVTEKTIVISDSYDAHAYKMTGAQKNEAVVLIVPYAYLSKFNKYKKGRKILNPIVKEEVFFDKFVRLLKEIDWNGSNAWAVEAGVDFLLSQLVSYLEL
ncbi:MAG: hypothetical protein E7381_05165, partial [Clostridiales bacterium]|nr:hypothetical protein [Clostridiales bacterium]